MYTCAFLTINFDSLPVHKCYPWGQLCASHPKDYVNLMTRVRLQLLLQARPCWRLEQIRRLTWQHCIAKVNVFTNKSTRSTLQFLVLPEDTCVLQTDNRSYSMGFGVRSDRCASVTRMLGRTPVTQNGCVSSHHIVKPENRVLWKDLLGAALSRSSCTRGNCAL